MKKFIACASVLANALCGSSVTASSSLASTISCMNADGVPATVVQTKSGKQVPIIYWKSQAFAGSGWSPERRCQEVSARFQSYHSAGTLEYITTGRMNGLPVICVAKTDGGACAARPADCKACFLLLRVREHMAIMYGSATLDGRLLRSPNA